jgi:hypothetical protein
MRNVEPIKKGVKSFAARAMEPLPGLHGIRVARVDNSDRRKKK